MPELPGHLYKGRGAFAGPVIGGYVAFCFGPKTYAATDAPTSVAAPISFIAPFDFRLEKITYSASSFTTAAATDTVKTNFYVGTTGIAAGDLATLGTALTSSGTTDMTCRNGTASTAFWTYIDNTIATAATTIGGGIATFNATDSVRNIARGKQVYCTVLAASTASDITNFSVQFVGFVTGHPSSDSTKD